MSSEVEQEARRDLIDKARSLEEAEQKYDKTQAVLAQAQKDAALMGTRLQEKRAQWKDALALYQTALSLGELSTMDLSEPTSEGDTHARQNGEDQEGQGQH